MVYTEQDIGNLRASLQDAVVKCSERCLYQSAKWYGVPMISSYMHTRAILLTTKPGPLNCLIHSQYQPWEMLQSIWPTPPVATCRQY